MGVAPPPRRFTYPFHYTPHPLAERAVDDLIGRLAELPSLSRQGKMFGVLVVRSPEGGLGYLAAYSGKLENSHHLPGFVPPVFDILRQDGFYKRGEREVNALNARVDELTDSEALREARCGYAEAQSAAEMEIADCKRAQKQAKRDRATRREASASLDEAARAELLKTLRQESIRDNFALKDLRRALRSRVARAEARLRELEAELNSLKQTRAARSAELQREIFAHYSFLNARGKRRDLNELFAPTVFSKPPAGAGDCAAPKLLQYAYTHGLAPVCMAEFWWGAAPDSRLRRQGHYYPACRGKCEPILGHMLGGLDVDPNPMLDPPDPTLSFRTVYEDEHLLVVSKPPGMLSVPGRRFSDSVLSRLKEAYPEATGPLLVHRLDMSTSGLLLAAKTKKVHKHCQLQFQDRTVQKRYVALLTAPPPRDRGRIDLPLRGDLYDRPRQLVDLAQGKPASTRYELTERRADGTALVHLWPETGRTHQLRVHAAHAHGLDAPIAGDDLYGQPHRDGKYAHRLHLHAEYLSLRHPITEMPIEFTDRAPF